MLANMTSERNRLQVWQEGDKYLRQDQVLGEAIDEHEVRINHAAAQEQKEMAEAAHKTILTLQEMLDEKNKHISQKEE